MCVGVEGEGGHTLFQNNIASVDKSTDNSTVVVLVRLHTAFRDAVT